MAQREEPPFFLLAVEDLARLYHVSPNVIGRWRKAGKIPPGTEHGHRFFWEGQEIADHEGRAIRCHYDQTLTNEPTWKRWRYEFEEPPDLQGRTAPRIKSERKKDKLKALLESLPLRVGAELVGRDRAEIEDRLRAAIDEALSML